MEMTENNTPKITVSLAKKLLEDKTAYLTEEGKQILQEMVK